MFEADIMPWVYSPVGKCIADTMETILLSRASEGHVLHFSQMAYEVVFLNGYRSPFFAGLLSLQYSTTAHVQLLATAASIPFYHHVEYKVYPPIIPALDNHFNLPFSAFKSLSGELSRRVLPLLDY